MKFHILATVLLAVAVPDVVSAKKTLRGPVDFDSEDVASENFAESEASYNGVCYPNGGGYGRKKESNFICCFTEFADCVNKPGSEYRACWRTQDKCLQQDSPFASNPNPDFDCKRRRNGGYGKNSKKSRIECCSDAQKECKDEGRPVNDCYSKWSFCSGIGMEA
eukprot:scaffold7365_cov121-Skeletonema_dohrnii-CCMP3373.AAC.1